MNRPPVHIRAALSDAGAAFAKHLRPGDHVTSGDVIDIFTAEVNYTLRSQGLQLVYSGPVLGWTVKELAPSTPDELEPSRSPGTFQTDIASQGAAAAVDAPPLPPPRPGQYVNTVVEKRIQRAAARIPIPMHSGALRCSKPYSICAPGSAAYDSQRGDELISAEDVALFLEGMQAAFEANAITEASERTDRWRAERFRAHLRAFLDGEGFEEER